LTDRTRQAPIDHEIEAFLSLRKSTLHAVRDDGLRNLDLPRPAGSHRPRDQWLGGV